MEQRIYHGKITPDDVARNLIAHFNRGNLRVQQIGSGAKTTVQIATGRGPYAGGQTALTVEIQRHADGVLVQLGSQAWFGIAASLGITALFALRNPFSLIGRLDDIAQDIENLQLSEEVWRVIDLTTKASGATHEISERLRRIVCDYCGSANQVGESNCIACGAPLGKMQPGTCPKCGFVIKPTEYTCPNCGFAIR